MKLGVCVPYRNREAHLKEFVPRIGKFLEERGIDYCMYFGHQTDDKLFNRGAMKNIAAEQAFKDGCDYIVWHDIDMVPEEGCDYSYPTEKPRHIATQISQMNYELKYEEYFGGAILFSKEQVERTNGYSTNLLSSSPIKNTGTLSSCCSALTRIETVWGLVVTFLSFLDGFISM